MQHCFREEVFRITLVFLDDIITFFKTLTKTFNVWTKCFIHYVNTDFNWKWRSADFFKVTVSVNYLGHVVSENRINTDENKIKCIVNWEVHVNGKQMKCYLGFAGCYLRFITHFSDIAEPLMKIIKTNIKYLKTIVGKDEEKTIKTRSRNLSVCFHQTSAPLVGYADFVAFHFGNWRHHTAITNRVIPSTEWTNGDHCLRQSDAQTILKLFKDYEQPKTRTSCTEMECDWKIPRLSL